ncbi:hypothetical protein CAPTEDRAFT_18513 [Capitella teleta]|uniref:Prefoldin subunit 5 n=1 Tax=Capitella teleta TaxID=283909 RepID=R7U062_CAPTE|nr:hypothetical protein CAPTEDRAFT_18513 [Capitella teleta]|eukprot:ELT99247.1 hypothetical protein CAPTEDRAFT_18513 [Capitella teleta]
MAKEIPINELNIPQLNQLAEQLNQELEQMQTLMSNLKFAQGKFNDSKECLSTIVKSNEGKHMLVPLTSCMYADGELDSTENVMIDIGTGYYVEKSVPEAKKYFDRKMEYLSKKMEEIQGPLQEKFRMKQGVMELLQMKVQAQLQASQTAAAKS